MAKTHYQLLEVAQDASLDTIQTMYERRRAALEAEKARGSEHANTQLWALNEAFTALSNADSRAAYDARLAGTLRSPRRPSRTPVETVAASEGSRFWPWIMAGLLVVATLWGWDRWQTAETERIRADERAAVAREAAAAATEAAARARAEAEAAELQRRRVLTDVSRDHSAAYAARSATTAQAIADTHQQYSKARQDRNQETEARRREADEARRRAAEGRYWACMNANLERGVSGSQSEMQCGHFRR